MKNKGTVFVGLSGGVDSSVSAALLKKQGYEVVGVFIKAWSPEGFPCTWKEDRRSAMKAAAVLDIPFKTLDLEKEYKKDVVDYMIEEYKKGRTPNPDVMCNKEIKFGHFLKWATDNGADFVATGHYAISAPQKPNTKDLEQKYCLLEGKDKSKDQSYFLWTLTSKQLSKIIFPIGHLNKTEVRKLATKFNLPQATRKDSQGLCFLGKIDMKEFLSIYTEEIKQGDVLDIYGNKIGKHNGSILYTIGERHGFTIEKNSVENKPMYVIEKNIEKNTITVGQKGGEEEFNKTKIKKVTLDNLNITVEGLTDNEELLCRLRYRQEKIKCRLSIEDKTAIVEFEDPQDPVAIGQSLVLYKGEICIGGGIITK